MVSKVSLVAAANAALNQECNSLKEEELCTNDCNRAYVDCNFQERCQMCPRLETLGGRKLVSKIPVIITRVFIKSLLTIG